VDGSALIEVVWGVAFLLLLIVVGLSHRARRRGGAYTAGVAGAMYEWQHKDKQKALDVVVAGKAAERRSENIGDNLTESEPRTPVRSTKH
jgi:hypothetical protein